MELPAERFPLSESDKRILRDRVLTSMRRRVLLFVFAAVCLAGVTLWMAPDLSGTPVSTGDGIVSGLILLVLVSPAWFPWLELQWRLRNGVRAVLRLRITDKVVTDDPEGPSYQLYTEPDVDLPMFIFAAIAKQVQVGDTVEIAYLDGTDEIIETRVQGVDTTNLPHES